VIPDPDEENVRSEQLTYKKNRTTDNRDSHNGSEADMEELTVSKYFLNGSKADMEELP
jgi:hypothetical protein